MNEEALRRIAEVKATESEKLDLSGLGLDVLPEQLRELTQLSHLELMGNQLTHLPAWLVELEGIETNGTYLSDKQMN